MLKEARTEGIEVGMEKGMVEEREKLIALIEKGIPLDEIKKILSEKQPSKDT
jgi:DNA-binding transcriptional MerR regulator